MCISILEDLSPWRAALIKEDCHTDADHFEMASHFYAFKTHVLAHPDGFLESVLITPDDVCP